MKKKHLKFIFGSSLSLILFVIFLIYKDLIFYGLGQLKGQVQIVWAAKPIEEILEKPIFPDSIQQKLVLINEIKRFAEDSLGLSPSENYTTVFDQKGKPILWVVTACPPFLLEAKTWDFPIAGSFSYKGFFDSLKAVQEAEIWKKEGFDVDIREVNAWSTLGWFRDPILSNMLYRKEGNLANLIIHELTHSTLYVKSDVTFNENLANFVGDVGAEIYLENKYGKDAEALRQYQNAKTDANKFTKFVLLASQSLDTLYQNFPPKMPLEEKEKRKKDKIQNILNQLDTVSFANLRYKKYFGNETPNNTFFMDYKRYNEQQDVFRKEFEKDFGSNFPKFLKHLKEKYGKEQLNQ